MQLTQFTDYSLRTLIYLAVHPEGGSVAGIARAHGISRNHVVKVAHRLGQLGVIATSKGRGGGLKLAHAPDQVNIGRLVRLVENFHLVDCLNPGAPTCALSPKCRLTGVLGDAQNAFLAVLDRYSLADLVSNADFLRGRLSAG